MRRNISWNKRETCEKTLPNLSPSLEKSLETAWALLNGMPHKVSYTFGRLFLFHAWPQTSFRKKDGSDQYAILDKSMKTERGLVLMVKKMARILWLWWWQFTSLVQLVTPHPRLALKTLSNEWWFGLLLRNLHETVKISVGTGTQPGKNSSLPDHYAHA